MSVNKLYVGVAGYDTIALPIVVVCCKIDAISLKAKDLYRKMRTSFKASFKDRMEVLKDCVIDYKAAYVYPDELTIYDKRTKISQCISNIVIQQYYKHQPDEIIISRDVPSISAGQEFLPMRCVIKSSLERNLANYQAQALREPYIIKAHQSYPQYEFISNRGEAKYKHYLAILKHGISRHHHSISKQSFYVLYRDLSLKENPILAEFYPYYKKTPKWWFDFYDQPIKDMYKGVVKDRIERTAEHLLEQKKLAKRLKDPIAAKYLSPLLKEPPQEFIQWVEDNAPSEQLFEEPW